MKNKLAPHFLALYLMIETLKLFRDMPYHMNLNPKFEINWIILHKHHLFNLREANLFKSCGGEKSGREGRKERTIKLSYISMVDTGSVNFQIWKFFAT